MNRRLYINRFTASFADYGLMFLIPLLVFQTTGNAALSGLAFSAEYFVKVLSGPFVGLMVDRFHLIRLLTGTNIVRALACFSCAILSLVDLSLGGIVFLALVNGFGFTVHFMAQETLLTELVDRRRFPLVQAKVQQLEQLALVSSPILLAVVIELAPASLSFALVGVLFLVAHVLLKWGVFAIELATPPDAQRNLLDQIKENVTVGQQYLLRSKPLQKVVASTFLINLIYGTLLAIGAVAVTGQFERSAQDFAWLQTSGAVAAIGVLFIVSRVALRFTPTQLGFCAFCMMSLGGVLSGMASGYYGFVLGAILVLSFDGVFNVYIRTRRMEIIERKDFGKAIGLLMIVNNLSKPLSGLFVFWLANWFSVTQILLIVTLVTVFFTLGFRLFSVTQESVASTA